MSETTDLDELAHLLNEWMRTKTWTDSRDYLKAHAEQLLSDEAFSKEWIKTKTWEESREMLKANAEKLLSDDAFEAMDKFLSWNDDEEIRRMLEQHQAILQMARTESIDAAYAELLQKEQLYTIANMLARAATPWQVQQVIAHYPPILTDETIEQLSTLANETEQNGNSALAQALRLRLYEVQRMRQQQEQLQADTLTIIRSHATGNLIDISADRQGIAVYDNPGTITLVNQKNEYYALPDRQWQQPGHQSFRERKAFVGRQDELDTMLRYLGAGENVAITGSTTKAAALQGMGGIGKSYLARKIAVELQDQLPGRCIWITLGPKVRDKTGVQIPLSELASYAFGGQQPPTQAGQLQPETVKAWLEEMAPGRFLVVLDDIWHLAALKIMDAALPAQAVRLVTTRYATIAEEAGGRRIILGRLTHEDGLALLANRLGTWNGPIYQADLEQLVDLLEGHALALDIAAGLIKKFSRLRSMLQNLRKEIGRGELSALKLAESEERDTNLEKSLALSYEMMSAEQRSRFRALGVFATETLITPEAASAVWNIEDLDAAKTALFELEDLALLTEAPGAGELCYQQHGLLRAYARALLEKENELISTSWAHAHYYTELVIRTAAVDARQLDQHMSDLLAALDWTAEHEPDLFTRLLSEASQFLLNRGQSVLLESYLPQAIQAATEIGNQVRLANLLQSLGDLERRLGNIDQARTHYDAALPLYRLERDRLGEANLLRSLGRLFLDRDDWSEARIYYEQALPLYIAEREPLGQANTFWGLAWTHFELGNHDQGMHEMQQAAELFHTVRDEEWENYAKQNLATMRERLEDPESS